MADPYEHLTAAEREWLKLAESSTPGPWEQVPQNAAGPMIAHPFDTGQQIRPRGLRLICHVLQRGNSIKQDDANAAFITASRTAVPQLLAEVSRLRGALSEARRHFLDYAAQHKAKGTPDGDMKAAVNKSRADDCERALNPPPGGKKETM